MNGKTVEASSQLTEFAPLSPEASQPGVGFLFSKFFKFNRTAPEAEFPSPTPSSISPDINVQADWQSTENMDPVNTDAGDLVASFPVDVDQGRSLPNVLKRISSLLALKSTGLQSYKDTDFKQYWMPDSVSKECYDCGEKFTTFRRRHHCRICGQIFCSRCCNQEITGKIMGCTGDLRVCTYCCKVVLSYLQSADMSADLRALQEDLQTKFGHVSTPSSMIQSSAGSTVGNLADTQECVPNTGRRKPSLGFQEDKFALGRAQESHFMSIEERCRALQKSASLRALYEDICRPNTGLTLLNHRYRLRNYPGCFLGSELNDWLVAQSHAATRIQATAIGQALLEAGYIENISEQNFIDGYALYKPKEVLPSEQFVGPGTPDEERRRNSHDPQEPYWVKQITQQESTTTDSESECHISEHDETLSLPSSGSTFYLDLNIAENTVHLSRPLNAKQEQQNTDNEPGGDPKPTLITQNQAQDLSRNLGLSKEFLSGALLLPSCHIRDVVPESGWHKVKQLRSDNGELDAFTRLSAAFKQHEQNMLKQLLNAEGLSQSWMDVMIPLVENIVDAVRPDAHNDADDMDIRQYVQFKKVPGGSRNESCIVNGVVCTKNVAHRAMATELSNPRILLLGCSIVYQRIEGRLLSLEPVMMQEHEYLRHVVARIANLQPDLVLVHRNVSRLAQEFLLALKVTLVLNVKASVLERIARCTQAHIISTVDAHIGRPQLGTCQSFYLKTFHNEKGPSKTLMFFEGCSSQHLGCTVILRGAANSELAKLKRVASRLVFIHYSWRLEKSYLMDEFARPPSPPADTFFEENTSNGSPQDERRVTSEQCLEINISEPIKGESFKVKEIEKETTNNNQPAYNVKPEEIKTHSISEKHSNSLESTEVVRTLDTKEIQDEADRTINTKEIQEEKLCKCSFDNGSSIDRKSSPHIYCIQRHSTGNVEDNIDKSENNRVHKSEMNEWKSMNEIIRIESKEKSVSEEKRMNVESVSDFSDPLRNFVYLSQDDEVFVPSSQSSGSAPCLSVAELPLTNRFRKALDDTILSSSPFLKFTVPYLETEAGRNCALRKYFPDEIFWSAQFEQLGAPNPTGSTRTASSVDGVDSVLQDGDLRFRGLKMQLRPQHPFVSAKLTSPADSNEVQTLLANFRACGGRLVPCAALNDINKLNRPPTRGNSTTVESTSSATSGVVKQGTWCDALDPANHQKLSVLFCSYSHESQNAPAFCVNPWVVHMDFYGHNDIPLGSFLERYCFRSSYVCPSDSCSTPMLKHVRRFVHDMGCVQIMLKDLDEPISEAEENHILMWNRCSKCKMVSPAVPMSADTWALSFAKYLELRFHGGMYRRRGQEGNVCAHSLHYDHCQFFAMKNIVAYFEYTSISQWEISLPPPLITTYYDPQQQANVIEEIKMLALKGYEVYTSIQEKLCTFEAEMEVIVSLKQQLQKEQAYFKSCIEEIQLKLTSPTLEAKKLEGQMAEKDVQLLMWRIEDSVVNLKRLISEIVTSWNARIQDLLLLSKRRDEKHKKGEGGKPAPTASFSLEYDRMSSGSLHVSDDVVEVVPSSITTTQWEDTSSCSEGREDTSPSSPEPALMAPGAKAVLDCQEMTEGEDNLSLEASHDTVPLMDTEAQNLNTVTDATVPSHTDLLKNAEDTMEIVNRQVISGSPRGHVRSYSDVTPSVGEEGSDTKHVQTSDKKSVKTILSQLLPSSSAMAPIQSPLSCQEHHLSAAGCSVPVVVYENEPSSIIAYALSSPDYRRSLDEICAKKYASSDQATPSPVHKRKTGVIQVEKEVSGSSDSVQSSEAKRSGVLSFLRGSSSTNSTGRTKILDGVQYSTGSAPSNGNDTSASEVDEPSVASNKTDSKSSRASASNIEVQFSDGTCNFYCRVYFGEQFANLREIVLPSGEEGFIRSLSRCVQWAARGGKSGSNFCKTKDDRFVLKEMSKIEMQIFLDFAPNYFGYVQRCLSSKQPTLLGKIVGVYRIVYRNLTSNATLRSNLLVMENLFYSRYVTHKFDLKGSERNRLVNPVTADRDGEIVLLDENLLRRTCDDPLYILPHSKTVLTQAINNDTQFLASQSVMDYSLLVGLDKKRRELVVGIIDYIRTFTWDKKLETMVKSTGFLGGQGKQPTIVSPELYRARFIAAMHRYFLPVPDRWTGLGKGLDC